MTIPQKLAALGLELPQAPRPVGSYLPALRSGSLVFTSGQLPMRAGQLMHTGKVPDEVTLDEARQCAVQAVLNALAAAAAPAGGLHRVRQVVRMNVFVASGDGFSQQAQIANAASDLLVELFGQAGRHTRCAIGASQLPLDSPIELDLVLEVE